MNSNRVAFSITIIKYIFVKGNAGIIFDFERFSKNRMSSNKLSLDDIDVFPDEQSKFKLSSKDKHNVLIHTGVINDPKKKR